MCYAGWAWNRDERETLTASSLPPLRLAQVQPSDYLTFSSTYGSLIKSSLSTLRKKKKTKRKAADSKKDRDGAGFVVRLTKVVGPRRGAGVEKRRRLVRRRERELKKLWARKKRDEEGKAV